MRQVAKSLKSPQKQLKILPMDTLKKGLHFNEIWSAEVMVLFSLLLTQVQNCAWFRTFCSKKILWCTLADHALSIGSYLLVI